MANYKGGVTTICPYYLREAKLSISCESPITGSQNMTKFNDIQAKLNWQENICSTFRYGKCPIAKSLEITNEERKEMLQKANEQLVYDYIVSYTGKNLYPPSVREICEATHYSSTQTVYRIMKSLQELGLVQIESNKNRAIKLMGYELIKK